jgi:hypothetical protein
MENTFIFNNSASDEEIKMTQDILNGETITKANSKELIDKILKLNFIDQLHVYSCIHDKMYDLTSENDDILNFLSQNCFSNHRKILYGIVTEGNVKKLEEKYNIKIEINN